MESPTSHRWAPIEDLPENWREFIDPQVTAIVCAWHERRNDLEDRQVFKDFLVRLRRQWAIETGYIERLYVISDGATRTLIEKGLDAALLFHGDTDQEPQSVIAKIQDQLHALEGLTQFLQNGQPLTKSYIRQLHQVLTAHQDTYHAIDTLGQPVERSLPRGEWKRLPNDVRGPDEFRFEFCPPEHVEAEMDRLLAMHAEHEALGVPADIEAAWIHHRFSLIHPFTDGNGRIARCLATLVLLKAFWLPFVVTRDNRDEYIQGLRKADLGDLQPLVQFLDLRQKEALRKVLSIGDDALQMPSTINEIISSLRTDLENRRSSGVEETERVVKTARLLLALGKTRLESTSRQIVEDLHEVIPNLATSVDDSFEHSSSQFIFRSQLKHCCDQLNYVPNLFHHEWVCLNIHSSFNAHAVISCHGIGRGSPGLLCCAAMLILNFGWAVGDPNFEAKSVFPVCSEPFTFSSAQNASEVQHAFDSWMEQCLERALSIWKQQF